MILSKPIEVFVDNCIFSHSIIETTALPPEEKWLREQISVISQINKLGKQKKIEINYDLNVFIEGRKRSGRVNKEIAQKWDWLRPGPTFVNFQGAMLNNPEKEEWKHRVSEVQKWLEDESLDTTHLVQAELYRTEFFITTDKKLINKVRNKGKGFLKVLVCSPTDFLEVLDQGLPK